MLLDQIQSKLAQAQKNRDQLKIDTLRFLLGAAFNLQIEKGKNYALTDNDILNVISKQVKTHKESIEMFTRGKRQDLVDQEKAELEILKSYLPVRQAGLPAQMSESEIRSLISEIRKNNPGADFGTLMKLATGELKGKADGSLVAKILKE
ncbi:GatB/YqeY domain-containing protein [Candidatus Gottesmanbacteria bacterium]|nr:GatB/YqeY domain-containing protein [Candidatus Gottesmanbacteria bacterium]